MNIYSTNEYNGYGKQNYYHNEYRREGNEVVKYSCNRRKHFDGHESSWEERETRKESWKINDPNMPSWLRDKL